jgi:hypothetical protein
MKMEHRRIQTVMGVVMLALIACSLGGDGSTGDGEETATPSAAGAESGPTATGDFDDVILPVPLNQGLASLDSYRMTYTNDVYDSVAGERSIITFTSARDAASNATYTSSESQTATEDYQVITSDLEEQYAIGNELCIVQAGEAQFTVLSGMAREVMDLFSRAISINPIIENPEYTGEDVISGIPVHTYEFEIRSIGATSDAEVGTAAGHYAVAVDGQYLVDYRLDMELRSGPEGDPEAEYSVSFFEIKVEDINQPVEVVFPLTCQQASQFGPDQFSE